MSDGAPKRVVLIEDEPDILIYLTTVLEDHGYDVRTLEAKDSVDISVTGVLPHLIILDVMMPKRSGISIYQELRTSTALQHIPVAILSGLSMSGDAMSGNFRTLIEHKHLPEPDGFIDKPVELSAFIRLVNRLTQRRSDKDDRL